MSTSLVLGPVALLANLLKLHVAVHPAARALFAAETAKETCEAAALPWLEALERVLLVWRARRRRHRAQRDGGLGEDVPLGRRLF